MKQVGHKTSIIVSKSPGNTQSVISFERLKLSTPSIALVNTGMNDAGLYSLEIKSPDNVYEYPMVNIIVHHIEGK